MAHLAHGALHAFTCPAPALHVLRCCSLEQSNLKALAAGCRKDLDRAAMFVREWAMLCEACMGNARYIAGCMAVYPPYFGCNNYEDTYVSLWRTVLVERKTEEITMHLITVRAGRAPIGCRCPRTWCSKVCIDLELAHTCLFIGMASAERLCVLVGGLGLRAGQGRARTRCARFRLAVCFCV